MSQSNPEQNRCLGRNLNLRRCGRYVETGHFCDDHKYQPLRLLIFLFLFGAALLAYYSFFKPHQIVPDPNRDAIVAKQYRGALRFFLERFRLYLVCLPDYESLDDDILEAFDPKHPRKGIQITKITPELIKKLFEKYNFSKPVGKNCTFKIPVTTADLIIGELNTLNERCSDILDKYASTGNPKLINKIEIMKNRTDNLIGPYGPKDFSQLSQGNLHWLSELFDQVKDSLNLIDSIKSRD